MRILADENIPHSVVEILRKKDYDVVTLYEPGKRKISDGEVIEIAKDSNRTILTLDLDFGRIHYFASGKVVNAIVIRTKVPTPENVARLLARLLKIRAEPRGLVIVSEEKIRILQ